VTPFILPKTEYRLSLLKVELQPLKKDLFREIDDKKIGEFFMKLYGNQFLGNGQTVYFDYKGMQMKGKIIKTELMESGIAKFDMGVGMLVEDTDIEFSSIDSKVLKIKSSSQKVRGNND
jgi:hypothetical protein